MAITFSIEQLYHFKCGNCNKWWSVGDYRGDLKSMTCPFCSTKHNELKNIKPEKPTNEINLKRIRETALKQESTKSCSLCGSTQLVSYQSFHLKACYGCVGNGGKDTWIVWPLNEGQKPLIQAQR